MEPIQWISFCDGCLKSTHKCKNCRVCVACQCHCEHSTSTSPMELAPLLMEAGYKVERRLPSAGWILRAPDGRLVKERDFVTEIERLTAPGAGV